MRHGKKVNKLGRSHSHRNAMMMNMANSLLQHKRITTTLPKAKALRTYVEPIITKSKTDTTHSRRVVFSYLKDKEVVSMLFRDISEKVADRPGGYTRIIKLNNRLGDNAEMAIIELVDYNEIYTKGTAPSERKTTRRRGRGKAKAAAPATKDAASTEETSASDDDATEKEVKAEETKKDAPKKVEAKEKDSKKTETKKADTKEESTKKTEAKKETPKKDATEKGKDDKSAE